MAINPKPPALSIPPAPPPAPAKDACAETILKIALKIIVPLGTVFLLYFALPLTVSLIAMPIAGTASVVAMMILFKQKERPQPDQPLPNAADPGIRNNTGSNCWMNSLAQMIYIDRDMSNWFRNVPSHFGASDQAPLPNYATHKAWSQQIGLDEFERLAMNQEEAVPAPVNDALSEANRPLFLQYLQFVRGLDAEAKQDLFFHLQSERVGSHSSWTQYIKQDIFEHLAMNDRAIPAHVLNAMPAAQQALFPQYLQLVRGMDAAAKQNLFDYLRFARFGDIPANFLNHAFWSEYVPPLRLIDLVHGAGAPPADLLDAMPDAWRAQFPVYLQYLRGLNENGRNEVFAFLRSLGDLESWKVGEGLNAFGDFIKAYDEALRGHVRVIEFDSQRLRMAVHLTSFGRIAERRQEDTHEGLVSMNRYLPKNLKAQLEVRRHISGFFPRAKRLPLALASPMVSIKGSFPELQDLLERWGKGNNPEYTMQIDGVEYPVEKEESRYVTAPSSLWIKIIREHSVKPMWQGLERMMGHDWFPTKAQMQKKLNDSVDVPDFVEIQPIEGPRARYKLDGWIRHIGNLGGGHYISYKLGVDDAGELAWYLMDDSRVTRLTEEQMLEARKKCDMPHYTKIEE